MIVDDDVEFIETTSVDTLVGHLRADPALLLAAACYERDSNPMEKTVSNPCYAFNLTYSGPTVTASAPPAAELESAGLHRSHLVHNAFVARTAELRKPPDERQVVNEHETFFVKVQRAGWGPARPACACATTTLAPRSTCATASEQDNPVPVFCRNFRASAMDMPFRPSTATRTL